MHFYLLLVNKYSAVAFKKGLSFQRRLIDLRSPRFPSAGFLFKNCGQHGAKPVG